MYIIIGFVLLVALAGVIFLALELLKAPVAYEEKGEFRTGNESAEDDSAHETTPATAADPAPEAGSKPHSTTAAEATSPEVKIEDAAVPEAEGKR